MARKNRYASFKTSRFGRLWLLWLGVAVVLLVGLILALIDDNANQPKDTDSKTTTSKGETASSASEQASQKTPGSTSLSPAGEAPKTPYGNFVSTHDAGLSDNLFSTCNTSAGVKCKISFSQGGVTKSLDEKTTGADGAAYWTWQPQDIGLSSGSWQITATASANNKSSTGTDSRPLVIK